MDCCKLRHLHHSGPHNSQTRLTFHLPFKSSWFLLGISLGGGTITAESVLQGINAVKQYNQFLSCCCSCKRREIFMPLHKKSGLKSTEWIVLNIHLTFLTVTPSGKCIHLAVPLQIDQGRSDSHSGHWRMELCMLRTTMTLIKCSDFQLDYPNLKKARVQHTSSSHSSQICPTKSGNL